MNLLRNSEISKKIQRHDRLLLIGTIATIAGLFGSFALVGLSPRFIITAINQYVVTYTPALIVRWTILLLGDAGHYLHIGLSILLGIGLFSVITVTGLYLGIDRDEPLLGGIFSSLFGIGLAYILTGSVVSAIGYGVPVFIVITFAPPEGDPTPDLNRRSTLKAIAGMIGSGGLAAVFGNRTQIKAGNTLSETAAIESQLQLARQRSLDIEGIDPLVSNGFYEVDINSVNPTVQRDKWSLQITGEVEQKREFSFEELRNKPREHRFNTLRCVGDPLNGRKMDNALWTGTPIQPLLEQARPKSGCECVMLRAVDDYYEEFPLEALRQGFLAWGMNGRFLPRRHGYPVRALIPGHWGEINVKWLTEIEILDKEALGFWEKRGWHGTGPVNTVAKLHAVNHLSDGSVEIGGHAYAGLRGIQNVEVSTDGGETWNDAVLSETLPDEDTWRMWRYTFKPSGKQTVVVRAIDGTGTLQPRKRSNAYPSGATGWVQMTVSE
ncbi:MAG: molybdopterin-dependent oxidoreductase [Halobacteriaceae archaeon]